MFTLENFYKSREWEKFRAVIIQERTNEHGEIICACCGKPILRKYDCIAHHKVELDDITVNDANIAFNPDNIELIHFKCHNEKHRRFDGFYQKVYLVYGSPCSGKTSFVNENAYDDDLIIDVDRLWDAMCNAGRYQKENSKSGRPNRIKSNVLGVRDCIIDQIRLRRGMWRNAWIIGGYPRKDERERLVQLLKAETVFCDSTKKECLERAKRERPDEWNNYIENWFDSYTE